MTIHICPDCRLDHDTEPCELVSADCDCCRSIYAKTS